MKLGKKKLQELESGKIQFEDLNDRYFINSQDKIEVENVLKLLNENIYNFQEIVDKYKSIKDSDNDPCLKYLLWNKELFEELIEYNKLNKEDLRDLLNKINDSNEVANLSKNTVLLKHIVDKDIVSFKDLVNNFKNFNELDSLIVNEELFEELIQNNKLTSEDSKYLLNTIDRHYEVEYLCKNTSLLTYIIDKNIVSFKELVDKFKSIKDRKNDPSLDKLIDNEELFKELFENNLLNEDDLRYLLDNIDKWYELDSLSENTVLLKYIVENELFKELVDNFKNFKKFHSLLRNKELFEELMQSNKLNTEDTRYLLDSIDKLSALESLCTNISLIKQILNEFILNKKDVDRLNRMTEDNSWCEEHNIHTIFDYIEYFNKNNEENEEDHIIDNEEILKLNELNRKIYSFDLNENQRLELAEILKDSEVAQNRLIQIVESNLQDQYNSDTLKKILTKEDKKKKIKLNF